MSAVIKFIDRATDIILLLFFLLLMLIGFYTMYDTVKIYNASGGEDLRTYKPIVVDGEVNWDMSALSEDVVAWITVDETDIDYPVLQGIDNSSYLNKDPYGNYSVSGSIFLDYRNAPDFSDDYSLIYGHHMEYGHMFGALDEFINEDYFNSHRTGTLTVKKAVYNIEFFAILEADGLTSEIFVPDSAGNALQYVMDHAMIWYEPEEGRLIALSTCKFPETTERMILFGVIEDE